jgi:2-polyprenyl-3-methyl-5-hydroxy-6-metoxy-1,4-benzoquinol methylase
MTGETAAARRDELMDHIFHAVIGGQDVVHLYLGHKLGLYRALSGVDTATAAELAARAGIAERYAREWLEQQAAAGILDVAEETGDGRCRRYRLPDGAVEVLCDPESLSYLVPMSSLFVGVTQALPQVVEAFRSGGGVPYSAYGEDLRDGIAEINRPMFDHQLAAEWIPALPDIERRLRRGDPPARVLDLGCGTGRSTIALARAYPAAAVEGVDLDEASIEDARRHAREAGVADRVPFRLQDATDSGGLTGRYDLITLFQTLHDMAHPVQVLRGAREMLAPGGAVLVGDERVAEEFAAPGDDMDRFNYGWSAPHCLAAALVEPGAAGTGTVMRPDTLRGYARDAGFSGVTVLPIEHDFWWFYRLDP